MLIAAVVGLAVLLGGITVALAATGVLGSWFGGGHVSGAHGEDRSADGAASDQSSPPAFANAPVLAWQADADELHASNGHDEGELHVAQAVQIEGGLVAVVGDQFTVIDAGTGQVTWASPSGTEKPVWPLTCTPGPSYETAVCLRVNHEGSEFFVLDANGERTRRTVEGLARSLVVDRGGMTVATLNPGDRLTQDSLVRFGLDGDVDWSVDDWDEFESEVGGGLACAAMGGEKTVLLYGEHCSDGATIAGHPTRVVSERSVASSLSVYISGNRDGSGMWLFDDGTAVRAFDEHEGRELWSRDRDDSGLIEPDLGQSGYGSAQALIGSTRVGPDGHNVLLGGGGRVGSEGIVVNATSGEARYGFGLAADLGDFAKWVPSHDALIGFNGQTGEARGYDLDTGLELWQAQLEPGDWIAGGPNGIAIGAPLDEPALVGEPRAFAVQMYVPGDDPLKEEEASQQPADTAQTDGAEETVRAGVVPDFIPATCPEGSLLLSWAELSKGWLLVCGTDMETPSYMAFKTGGGAAVELNDLDWSAALQQFSGVADDGSRYIVDGKVGAFVKRDASESGTADLWPVVRIVMVPIWGDEQVHGFEHGARLAWTKTAKQLASGARGAAFPVAGDRRLDESWSDASALIEGAVVTEVHENGRQRVMLLAAYDGSVLWEDGVDGDEYDYSTVHCDSDPVQQRAYCLLTDHRKSRIVVLDGGGEVKRFVPKHPVANIAVDDRGLALVGYDADGTLLRLDHDGREIWDSEPIERTTGVITGIDFVGDRVLVRSTGGWELLDDRTGDRLGGFAYPAVRTVDDPVAPCEARLREDSLEVSGPRCPSNLAVSGLPNVDAGDNAALRWYVDAGAKKWLGPEGYLEQDGAGKIAYYAAEVASG